VRFLFLGTGTSAGIPAIGCDCPVCTSADPRDQRLRTAAALQFSDPAGHHRTILLDAGPDLRQQALRARLTRCDAVLFTHNHVDHIFGLDEVRRFNAVMNRPIDIYADRHTLDSLHRIYTHIFERDKNINDSFVATLIAHRVQPGEAIELHGLRITPIKLLHGKLPILGYRIDHARPQNETPGSPLPLAYCTDVSGIPPETWPALRGLRTLVLDALRHRRHPTHLTVEQAMNIADQVQAERTYFIHMTHDLAHAQTEAQLPDRVHLAYDGLTLGADSALFGESKPAPSSGAVAP
jgi:phosphoribosyl 1,2-cyclic phosphate phosphodiesterase